MARQTAAEKAEASRAQAAARAANEQAELARKKREVAELLTDVLGDALTGVSGSTNLPTSRDPLDVVLEGRPWPPRYSGGGHREGQIAPHKLSIFSWLKALPSMFEPFMVRNGGKEVPGNFWAMDEADGKPVAVISCPCGEEPVVGLGRFHFCAGGDCFRVFLYLGNSIRVAVLSGDQLEALSET